MDGCKSIIGFGDIHALLSDDNEHIDTLQVSYKTLVGYLMFASMLIRPGITYTVIYVARYCVNLCQTHWTTWKCILRYLQAMSHFGIFYGNPLHYDILTCYCHANYNQDTDTRRSCTRFYNNNLNYFIYF